MVALDLSADEADGLGAHRWYGAEPGFTPLQAELDRLPLAGGQMDLVIFNASLHYVIDYTATLREAQRVLQPDGEIVIMDSPLYRDPASGLAMVAERAEQFERRYGFRSDSIASEGFLTCRRLEMLGADLGLRWQMFQPVRGPGPELRRWRARLRGRREPARLPVIVARRS